MFSQRFPIKALPEIYEEVSLLVKNAVSLWSWHHHTTTVFRQRLPGTVSVFVGEEQFLVHRFLLEGSPLFHEAVEGKHREVRLPPLTVNFTHILTLLKIRWCLQLHSAMSELDHKLCSLRRLADGVLWVITQQFADAPSDSVFSRKVQQTGANLNLNSVLDDLIEQLQRVMGIGFDAFLDYVRSCDAHRSLERSSVDLSLPRVSVNVTMQNTMDDIYTAYLLRLPPSIRILSMIEDLETFQIRPPEVPEYDTSILRKWLSATTAMTKKRLEKSVQRQVVHLVANIEMRDPRTFDLDQPFYDKEAMDAELFDMLCEVVSHHSTFPAEIRERILVNVPQLYGLTKEQFQKMASMSMVNRDDPTLSHEELHKLKDKELDRLSKRTEVLGQRNHHCRLPSLSGMPSKSGKTPKYWEVADLPMQMRNSMEFPPPPQTREWTDRRVPFKVPCVTGPWTWDPDVGRFRAQGVFSKSGNLGS
mmetsp:Transcript_51774/g.118049  ORF Transcript_51774/g.118049 Transcript_51774/m.118049 type:complete len:474 (+) Transcript_51774:88-1509(+)|eukprot:CAMPEP_0204330682 /NCGR_PEP_ID=MMETSP0469-20131031/15116_1 /ASSEMBLY_ACC=CAM_ASM_000384 /TAXON_ID=2969 /ORGANISM="Oxyrrhis marina" /LENGTH=473 /DNA_ID=CAMNT_0051313531 /DNA_START=56 /DNA_END=1477 /DNA_ORIENTATION=-